MEDRVETRELSRLLWSLLLAAVVASAGVLLASRTMSAPTRTGAGSDGALYVRYESAETGTVVYRMPQGYRMRDLFRVAGRKSPVQIDGVVALSSGQSVRVEADGGVSVGWMPGEQMVALGIPVPLNECRLQDLVAIPGVGEATAIVVMKGRMERGRFDSFSEMADLPGIGEKTLAALRQYGRL